MNSDLRPIARNEDVLTEELDDELLVYDNEHHIACRLNRTAALVWQSSDGTRTVDDLVAVLREEVGEIADEDLVMVTLDELAGHGLLEDGYERRDPDTARLSRRRFIRRVGVVGTAALALPVVQSVVAPALAQAQSGTCYACTCPCGCYDYCEPCETGYCETCPYCVPC